ncbi:MAG TPA: hypothetical protein VMT17_20060 [Anaeromyxobacteraceae bacterium]|nr:hypothetical protein [Anaeromyxobacteraceae bacterium]
MTVGSETRDRFLKLERPREAAPGRVDPLAHDERFDHVGGEPAPHARPPHAPQPGLERFRPAPERPLEVAEIPDGAPPFQRCSRCLADSSRYASTCERCGAQLDTAEQRLFNERLWASRAAGGAAPPPPDAGAPAPDGRLGADAARGASLGMRLLERLPGPAWRALALVVGGGVPLVALLLGRGSVRALGLVALVVGAVLFAPPDWRRSERR